MQYFKEIKARTGQAASTVQRGLVRKSKGRFKSELCHVFSGAVCLTSPSLSPPTVEWAVNVEGRLINSQV